MGLMGLVMLFVVFLVFVFIVVGVVVKRKNRQNRPSLLGAGLLLLQLLLIVLFFSGITASFNELFLDVLWWLIVVCGLVVGIREVKNNIIIALSNIFLSILLAILMLLLLFITSM